MLARVLERLGNRQRRVVDVERLQLRLRAEHRHHRPARNQPGEQVHEPVVLAEQHRGAHHGRLGERRAHARLAFALGRRVAAVGARVGADRRDVDERPGPGRRRSLGRRAGALDLQRPLPGAERADEVGRRVRALHRRGEARGIAHVAAHELDLPEAGQRAQAERLLRVALGDAQPRAAPQQLLREMRAEKAAAADQHDQLVFERRGVSHGVVFQILRRRDPCGAGRERPCNNPAPPARRLRRRARRGSAKTARPKRPPHHRR